MDHIIEKALEKSSKSKILIGVKDQFLNRYLQAHHKNFYPNEMSVYKGDGEAGSLGVKYKYDIAQPPIIHFQDPEKNWLSVGELPSKTFSKWLMSIPEVRQTAIDRKKNAIFSDIHFKAFATTVLPTVTVEITIEGLNKPIEIDFSFTLACFVQMDNKGNIDITPLNIEIGDPKNLLTSIESLTQPTNNTVNKPTCYELKDIVFAVINNLISPRIRSFVQQFKIPTVAESMKGVKIDSLEFFTLEDTFIIGADLYAGKSNAPLKSLDKVKVSNAASENFFICMRESAFDDLVKTSMVISKRDEDGDIDHLLGIRYEWNTWAYFRTENPRASLDSNEVKLQFDFFGSAGVKVRVSTHCGWTPWVSAKIEALAKPFSTNAGLHFSGRSVDLIVNLNPSLIPIYFVTPLPWPIDELASVFLTLIASMITVFFDDVNFSQNILEIPTELSSLPVKLDVNMRNKPTRIRDSLAIIGGIDFII